MIGLIVFVEIIKEQLAKLKAGENNKVVGE